MTKPKDRKPKTAEVVTPFVIRVGSAVPWADTRADIYLAINSTPNDAEGIVMLLRIAKAIHTARSPDKSAEHFANLARTVAESGVQMISPGDGDASA